MNIANSMLAFGQVWFFNLLLLPLLFITVRKVDWLALVSNKSLQHRFFGASLALLIIWQIDISLSLEVSIHFLGVTTLSLMFGWPLALLACLIAQMGYLFLGHDQLESFALNYFINGVIPVFFTWRVHLLIESFKPKNPFAFIMGSGFLSCLVSSSLVAFLSGVMLYLGGAFSFNLGFFDYVSYLPLFIFPEAVVNGMFISGFSILHPKWVVAFNDERYFQAPSVTPKQDNERPPGALDLDAQEDRKERSTKETTQSQKEWDIDQYRPPSDWTIEGEEHTDVNEKDSKKDD